ncbi:MAG: TonB-dependent receptor [Bacteroidetes bacterium]|nr:TonB-dependent receptor [Bacteroidota bacterium]
MSKATDFVVFVAAVLFPLIGFATGDSAVTQKLSVGQVIEIDQTESFYQSRIVTREEIDHLNIQNLNDLIRYQFNFLPVYTGTDGFTTDYTGNGRKGMKVLLDGLPVWQSSIDQIDLNRFPLSDVERIEFLYGTSADLYGSHANSVVINIVTRWRDRNIAHTYTNFNFSGKDEYNVRTRNYFNLGRHRLAVGGGRYFFNGLQGSDSNRVYQWKPILQYQEELMYKFLLLPNVHAYLNMNNTHTQTIDRGYPIPNSVRVYDNHQRMQLTTFRAGIRGMLSRYHMLDFSHVYNRYRLTNDKEIKILSDMSAQPDPHLLPFDQLKYDEYFAQIRLARANTEQRFDYSFGMEFSHQRDLQRSVLYAVKTNITQLGIYGRGTYKANENLWFRTGLRYNSSDKFNTPLIYNGQMKYRMSENAVFLGQIARGYRIPTFNEQFYTYEDPSLNIKGNLGLKAETYRLFNAVLNLGNESFRLVTNMFWQSTKNAIQLVRVNPENQVYQFLNTKSAKFTGQSIGVQLQQGIVRAELNLANNGVNQFPEEIGSYYFYQEMSGRFFTDFKEENFSLMYAVKYGGKRSEIRKNALGELEDFNQNNYWMMDVSFRGKLFNDKIVLSFGVKNLTNTIGIAGKYLPLDRLSDDEINSKVPFTLDIGRRGWISISCVL